MKIVAGFLGVMLMSLVCFVPVSAGSFGLSPASVAVILNSGESKVLQFKVVGYSGLVVVNSENMPVTITPSSFNAVAGSSVPITIKCNSDAVSGSYSGKIVFLAKSGGNVQSGIKALCNLTVNGSSSGGSSSGTGGIAGELSSPSFSSPLPLANPASAIATIPDVINKDNGENDIILNNVAETKTGFNFLFFSLAVVAGLLLAGLLFVGYKWIQKTKI